MVFKNELNRLVCEKVVLASLDNLEAEFLDEIQTKVLRAFLLAIHSHLYSYALRFLFLQIYATSYSFYSTL